MAKHHIVSRRSLLRVGLGAGLGCATAWPNSSLHARPNTDEGVRRAPVRNVVLITADDLHWESTGIFSDGAKAITPNITRFGQSAHVFHHSHVAISGCWPSRAAICTGLYPHRNGSIEHRNLYPEVSTIVDYLQGTGMVCGVFGKIRHTIPSRRSEFDRIVTARQTRGGRSPDLFARHVGDFIRETQSMDKRFFLNINFSDPHRPFADTENQFSSFVKTSISKLSAATSLNRIFPDLELIGFPNAPAAYQLQDVPIPAFLPELPAVRKELFHYYRSVARLDEAFGAVMNVLDRTGVRDSTAVIFLSDNGIDMPFGKANVYHFSTNAGLSVRLPGMREARHDTSTLVSTVDILPTILELLDIPLDRSIDGRSFLDAVVDGRGMSTHREALFTYFHTRPMRAVVTRDWQYIYNHWSDGAQQFIKIFLNTPSAKAMRESSDPAVAQRYEHLAFRQREEFYDIAEDPGCFTNLIDTSPAVDTARRLLSEHLASSGDPLADAYRPNSVAGPGVADDIRVKL